MEEVILVDTKDNIMGYMEKQEAHIKGLLHRAFSIFIFNSNQQLLMHQRALDKYHSGGLWTNTCCSHPRKNESIINAAHRRLNEEMGLSCDLDEKFTFIYKSKLDQNLYEHEFDHVLFGYTDEKPNINKNEVLSYKYLSLENIKHDIKVSPNSIEDIIQKFRILETEEKRKEFGLKGKEYVHSNFSLEQMSRQYFSQIWGEAT